MWYSTSSQTWTEAEGSFIHKKPWPQLGYCGSQMWHKGHPGGVWPECSGILVLLMPVTQPALRTLPPVTTITTNRDLSHIWETADCLIGVGEDDGEQVEENFSKVPSLFSAKTYINSILVWFATPSSAFWTKAVEKDPYVRACKPWYCRTNERRWCVCADSYFSYIQITLEGCANFEA